jgi:hypothetical protein
MSQILTEMDCVRRLPDVVCNSFLEFGVSVPVHTLWVEDTISYSP